MRFSHCCRAVRFAALLSARAPFALRGGSAKSENMARSAIFALSQCENGGQCEEISAQSLAQCERKQCAVRAHKTARTAQCAVCENREAVRSEVRARGATPAHTISPRQKHRHECVRERREAPRPWRLIWWIRSRQSPWAAPPNGGGRRAQNPRPHFQSLLLRRRRRRRRMDRRRQAVQQGPRRQGERCLALSAGRATTSCAGYVLCRWMSQPLSF